MGLFLSAEMTDYSDALAAISQQLTNISTGLAGLSETVKLLVGVAAGIVCFLGMLFGFNFIKTLLQQFKG